jgi:hypothetical protein
MYIAVLGAACAVLGWGGRARAFCRTTVCQDCELDPQTGCTVGQPIAWKSSCVTFAMQHDGSRHVPYDEAAAAIGRAFEVWQVVDCPDGGGPPAIRVRTTFGDAACRRHEYNQTDGNANIVMFRDDAWPYTNATNALALTTVTYNFKTGEIYDADMEVNATQDLSVDEDPSPFTFDLQSIITHEAGHFLGLNHSLDSRATMWSEYSRGSKSFRTLSDDDIAGICAVYPPRTAAACNETPRQGFSPTCGIAPTSGGSCAVAAAGAARSPWSAFALSAACGVAGATAARRRRKPRRSAAR